MPTAEVLRLAELLDRAGFAYLDSRVRDTKNVCQSGPADLLLLEGAGNISSGTSQFGVASGSIGSGAQLIVNQHMDGLCKNFAALEIRLSRMHGLFRRDQGQETVDCRHSDIQTRQSELVICLVRRCSGRIYSRPAGPKVDEFPRKQETRRTSPHALCRGGR